MSDSPILPPLAIEALARAEQGFTEVSAGIAQAANICETAAKEGAPSDACVYLDMLLCSIDDSRARVKRLHALAVQAVFDRRKEPRGNP